MIILAKSVYKMQKSPLNFPKFYIFVNLRQLKLKIIINILKTN